MIQIGRLTAGMLVPKTGIFWSGWRNEDMYEFHLVACLFGWSYMWRFLFLKNNSPLFWR